MNGSSLEIERIRDTDGRKFQIVVEEEKMLKKYTYKNTQQWNRMGRHRSHYRMQTYEFKREQEKRQTFRSLYLGVEKSIYQKYMTKKNGIGELKGRNVHLEWGFI